ncbi:MAG: RsmE family RNA methyltransferase [Bdellovibrionota bacterium]
MKRLLCQDLQELKDLNSSSARVVLPKTEAHHAITVLRIKDGEMVEAIDGKGLCLKAVIRISGKTAYIEAVENTCHVTQAYTIGTSGTDTKLVLETSILKSGAMEWLVEKCVELGVSSILPVITDHTVVKVNTKGPDKFRDRWQKIADQSLKQCGRLKRLEVQTPAVLREVLKSTSGTPPIRLWCDEEARHDGAVPFMMNWLLGNKLSKDLDEIRLLIGPEGGWSATEQNLLASYSQHNIHRVSLGKTILRAETAGIFAVSLVTGCLWLPT